MAIAAAVSARAAKYSYSFGDTPVSEALVTLSRDHSDLGISFIYKELDYYRTSARVDTDSAYEAIRAIVGLNPISVIEKKGVYYIEALQHGRHTYYGQVVDGESEPVEGATVLLLSRRDSSVVTYGVTDGSGRFAIPCDLTRVVGKVVCLGYLPLERDFDGFQVGKVELEESPMVLNAVTVEADRTTLFADKTVYRPTRRQKQFSQSGTDLLRLMAIPTLVISPETNTVSDVAGNGYDLFINYREASREDIRGMNMAEVKRVEVIENPTDSRFKNSRRVVNFIVQEYEYGGYSKVSASETALNGLSSNVELFSKFAFRRMTYDLYAGAANNTSRHGGSDTRSVYNAGGGTIVRDENTLRSRSRTDKYPVTVRGIYRGDRIEWMNMLSYSHIGEPEKAYSGTVTYTNLSGRNYEFGRSSQWRENNLGYTTSVYWDAPGGFSLNYWQKITHSHRNTRSGYDNEAVGEAIANHALEDVLHFTGDLYATKKIGTKHRFKAGVNLVYVDDDVNYRGSNPFSDNMKTLTLGLGVDYSFQTRKLRLYLNAGFNYEHLNVNGAGSDEKSPFGNVGLNYVLSDKQRLNLNAGVYVWSPSMTLRQDAVVQSDELMYITGNSRLHNYKQLTGTLSYNINASSKCNIAVFAGHNQFFNRVATIYMPYKDGKAILRGFANDGNYMRTYAGASATVRLFDNALQLYGNITQNRFQTTGLYTTDYWPVRLQLQATAYLKDFYILGSWSNGSRTLTENSNVVIRNLHTYIIEAGWGSDNLKVALTARNIFSRSYKSSYWERRSHYYSEYQTNYAPGAHASLTLRATYTIGYGKKVRTGNEVGEQTTTSSAILR